MGLWKRIRKIAQSVTVPLLHEEMQSPETLRDLTGTTAAKDMERLAEASAAEKALAESQATEEAYAALEADRKRRAKIKGRSSTILTSPLGAIGLDIQRKMLLGG